MSEIRALIVDDEPLARRGIRQLLTPYPDITVVAECRDGREAVRALATLDIDLVFLDVQMPGLDGLDVIRIHGAERMPITVFVTAHDAFAVHAFEAQALDYLVKPLSEARFRAAMTRVRDRIRTRDALALAGRLSALLHSPPATLRSGSGPASSGVLRDGARIAVPSGTGERMLDSSEVDWVEAQDDHIIVHAGASHYRIRATLRTLESVLDPAHFVRAHRSALVRLDRVGAWSADGAGKRAVLQLHDGTRIPISRRRLARVKALLRSRRLDG